MKQPKIEVRGFSVRATGDDSAFVLEGYAATFGTRSAPIGGQFYEIIAPGAFSDALENNPDIHATVQHNFNTLLGRTKNGSLTLEQDDKGLRFSIALDKNSSLHREVFNNVKSGLLDECSFSFNECVDTWEPATKECPLPTRTITKCGLFEIAAVALPAYSGTSVDARSAVANSGLLAKVQALPALWEQQSRAHAIALEISRSANTPAAQVRSSEDGEDDLTDEIQKALAERFGSTRSGQHPAHFLVRYDATRCYTRHLDSDTRCRMEYTRNDEDDYDFGDVEPDCDYSGETGDRSVAAQAAQNEENLRHKMAIAAGRTR
jgi:uncharacterized protein